MADKKPMGIGVIGQPDTEFKRKFRWTFEIFGFCKNEQNVIPEHFVNIASRPNLTIESTEINHLHAKTWIPGKASWETISVTYLDVAHVQMKPLWDWMATIYDLTDPVNLRMGSKRDWDATGVLTMYDGCGNILETWELKHLFPEGINFGDVDYSSSDIATIELTLRYSDVKYRSHCPGFEITPCCVGCV